MNSTATLPQDPTTHMDGDGATAPLPDDTTWKPLRIQNIYRLLLASLATLLAMAETMPTPLGEHSMTLFQAASLGWLLAGISAMVLTRLQIPGFLIQVYGQIMVDILAITLLMHASGGVQSGIGVLLIVVIANGSLLVRGRMSTLFAAIAALSVLGEQAYSILEDGLSASTYTHAGLLGAGFFATATLGHMLARRIRESEALAEKRGVDLENMAQLTSYIIQRMQTGIIVVDADQNIRLLNESARHLLVTEHDRDGTLDRLCPQLQSQLSDWQEGRAPTPGTFRNPRSGAEIQPRFARLGQSPQSGILIFLEDTVSLAQQAQQLKLASLGRLTASIAHEIRNPLSAINHASQLLSESAQLDAADARLSEIIQHHTRRVDAIIENIMQLSRRSPANPKTIPLSAWLQSFIDDFCHTMHIPASAIHVRGPAADLEVQFDASQLSQIMWNLCENGWRHSHTDMPAPLTLGAGIAGDGHTPYLEVVDNGDGIADEIRQDIFEPFFTTASSGTGLGLYIARELCEINRAHLSYRSVANGGACFRITFADPRRQQPLMT